VRDWLVQPARLEPLLLDPQVLGELRIGAEPSKSDAEEARDRPLQRREKERADDEPKDGP
jgi:hypothetical protein